MCVLGVGFVFGIWGSELVKGRGKLGTWVRLHGSLGMYEGVGFWMGVLVT